MVIFASPSPPNRKTLVSAVSTINNDASDDNEDVKSIQSYDDGNNSRESTAASRSSKIDKRTKEATDRTKLPKKRSGCSTMIMPATAFGGISRGKSLRWALIDGQDDKDEDGDDGSSHSLSTDVINALDKARSRHKRSSLSQPAAEETERSTADITVEDDRYNDATSAKKRSSLTQLAAMQILGIIEDEDLPSNIFDSDHSQYGD